MLSYLRDISEEQRKRIGLRARRRVLTAHTAMHRAVELERFVAAAAASALNPIETRAPNITPMNTEQHR